MALLKVRPARRLERRDLLADYNGGPPPLPPREWAKLSHASVAPVVAELPHDPRAAEDAGQSVIVLDRDRVELVIVAPRASDGQPEERLAGRVDDLVDHLEPQAVGIRLLIEPG